MQAESVQDLCRKHKTPRPRQVPREWPRSPDSLPLSVAGTHVGADPHHGEPHQRTVCSGYSSQFSGMIGDETPPTAASVFIPYLGIVSPRPRARICTKKVFMNSRLTNGSSVSRVTKPGPELEPMLSELQLGEFMYDRTEANAQRPLPRDSMGKITVVTSAPPPHTSSAGSTVRERVSAGVGPRRWPKKGLRIR